MASVGKQSWSHKGVQKSAWLVRWRDAGGVQRSKSFELKKSADTFKRKVEDELEAGVHVAPRASNKVAKLAEEYIASLSDRLEVGTIERATFKRQKSQIEFHILPQLGGLSLVELSEQRLDVFVRYLRRDANLSIRTVRSVLLVLKMMVDFAMRRKWVGRNVVRDVLSWPELRAGRVPRVKTFVIDDVKRLLVYLHKEQRIWECKKKGSDQRTPYEWALIRLAVYLAAICGLRRGEIAALKWEDVDFETRTISIQRSMQFDGELKGPKSAAGYRVIPMAEVVASELLTWRSAHWRSNKEGFILRGRHGGALTFWLRNTFVQVCSEAGLIEGDESNPFHFHALRHFAASMMVETGVPLADLAKIMGHDTFDVTLQTYTHPVLRELKRHAEMDRIAAMTLPQVQKACDPAPLALTAH